LVQGLRGAIVEEFARLESIFAAAENFKLYRELKKIPPYLPFLGMLIEHDAMVMESQVLWSHNLCNCLAITLRDLTFIDDGNPNFMDAEKTSMHTQAHWLCIGALFTDSLSLSCSLLLSLSLSLLLSLAPSLSHQL
jgi:hypothetical protein